jgi:hypothetical protein
MGALVRYFDEIVIEDDRRRRAGEQKARDAVQREVDLAREREEEQRAQAIWAGLSEPEQAAVRAAVLAEQPMLRRFPPLLAAACVARAARDGYGQAEGDEPGDPAE